MAIEQVLKDLGAATAYAYAVEKGYTGTEAEFAELMASYASVAQSAAASATAAAGSATSAASSASTASAAATTATTKASEASTSATNAAGSASSAASSATAASGSATSAAASATTASGKASEAATAAATAVSAKDDAVSANTAAQSAKTAAQTAQTSAETAAASVQASAAQIQTNADDISELKEDLTQKANIDGSYEDLVSGGAYQIISNMEETDTTPYGYRTAGGSLEIGDREKLKKIVGGSLAVNQLVYSYTVSACTASASNGIVTITPTNSGNRYRADRQGGSGIVVIKDHVYAQKIIIKSDGETNVGFQNYAKPGVLDGLKKTNSSSWVELAEISKAITSGVCYTQIMTSSASEPYQIKENSYLIFDLTAMFGTTIADYVYGLETATAGAGVAWLKAHFPKIFDAGYIPYNAGTLEHVSGLSAHKMTGFNQFNPSVNSVKGAYRVSPVLIGKNNLLYMGFVDNDTSVNVSDISIGFLYDLNFTTALPTEFRWVCQNGVIGTSASSHLNKSTLSNLLCSYIFVYPNTEDAWTRLNKRWNINVNIKWDGERDGEYEPYEEHSYPLDSDVTLRGIPKLDANNSLYYDGDEYTPDGTVGRNIDFITFNGTENWVQTASSNTFYVNVVRTNMPYKYGGNMMCYGEYSFVGFAGSGYSGKIGNRNGMCAYAPDTAISPISEIAFKDLTCSTLEEWKAKLASKPLTVAYELATPTTESADPYTEIQNVSNWGTEEFVTTSLVPVGHETAYQPDLRAKIEVAPELPDTDGLYLMKRENGQNSYVAYLGELPSDPTTDGTYTLKCTVASGTATKTWEADE